MNWITILWSLTAGACLTMAVTHLLIWFKSRIGGAHVAFAIAAIAVAGIAACELKMMEAGNPAEFANVGRWIHVPIFVLVVLVVFFVRLYFQTGRPWLGWAAVGIRFLSLVLNFAFPVNLHYREITALRQIDFLGQPVSVVAEGTVNPLGLMGPLSSLLIVLYVLDASIRLWRRGGHDNQRRALVIGSSIAAFIVLSTGHGYLIHARVIQSPYLISFFFLGIVAAMAHELSHDVITAARLTKVLHQAQQQMTLAASAAKLALWTWDIPGNHIWVTDEGRILYGVPPDTTITVERFLETIHPEDRDGLQRAMKEAVDGVDHFAHDYRVLLPGGQIRWISARAKVEFDEAGSPLVMRGVSMDNSERRQAEERAKLVVEAAPNAMIMVDAKARMVLVNAQAESTFGYSRDELLGQPIELLIPGRFKAGHPAMHQGFFAHPSARAMGAGRELFGLRKDGTEVAVEVGLNPISTLEGRFVLASVIDITERKRAEQEAREQRDELFHLSRVSSLGQLSGSLAHELNQPLGIILSNAQAAQRMLAQEPLDLPELREILADIVSEDRRAGEVITRLRALLKRGETRLLPLAPNDVIEDVVRLLRSDLIAQGVTIQTALADGLPKVAGDEVQLQQVLLNLIINACDAMAENPAKERILRISTSQKEGKVCISVDDQGCGLPDGDADRIFQPFVTTKSHGLGIGLSICRSIIVAHHGRLWAEPNAGRGTTLHLELQTVESVA